jgi:NADH-quinone oxidoreductase subunit F
MDFAPRVLDADPVTSLEDHINTHGGGKGLEAARRLGPSGILDDVEASGLRGRGGGGFPTGTKWRTVVENAAAAGDLAPTVVVNGAEGEPGTFKDRAILRRNPYRTLEGALIAAQAVGATRVVVGLKRSFTEERDRVAGAIGEIKSAGWLDGVDIDIVEGPEEYLFGEETGLLEVIEGRAPFPRIAPPYRHGVDDRVPAPSLVNNVETLANVPAILSEGPEWFRSLGTAESPGTIVCTISGRTKRHGVAEFPMGTPLRTVIDSLGGGASGQQIVGAMSGVANTVVPPDKLDTPLTYEDMEAIGSGLGAEGFIVFDDTTDMAAVAHGVARFLAVESCGQCTPCKGDGLAIAGLLDDVRRSAADENTLARIDEHLVTVTDEARCFLAHQQQRVINSIMQLYEVQVAEHVTQARPEVERAVIAPIVDLDGDRFTLADEHLNKQPDWSYDEVDSGQFPAQRIDQAEGET